MNNPEQSFEQAVKQLANLVAQIESQSLSLEETLKAYEQGMRLSQYCQQQLAQAKQQVQILQSGRLQPLGGMSEIPSVENFSAESVRTLEDLDDEIPF